MDAESRPAGSERRSGSGRRPRDFPLPGRGSLLDPGFTETPRERQVLDAVTNGLENKEIAAQLGISEQRVKELVSALFKKFGVPSRAALARAAVNMRILGLDTRGAVPYSYLFDESPVLIAVMEGPEHRYVLVNSAYARAFGERDYIGRTVRECFPDAPKDALAALDRAYGLGEPHLESERQRVYVMPDGTPREFILSFVVEPVRSAANAIVGVAVYGWDVTSVVATRRPVGLLTRDERRILDELPTGIVHVGSDGSTLFVNKAARAQIGVGPDSLPAVTILAANGRPFPEGLSPGAVALRGLPVSGKALLHRMDGSCLQVQLEARPHRNEDGGSISGALIVLRSDPS